MGQSEALMAQDWTSTLSDYFESEFNVDSLWDNGCSRLTSLDPWQYLLACYYFSERSGIYFETNGLCGLIESELGRMIPEWIKFLDYLGCNKSAALLESECRNILPDAVRDDKARDAWHTDDAVYNHLDLDVGNELDETLRAERYRGRLHSFAAYIGKKLLLTPIEFSYIGTFEPYVAKQGEWDRLIASEGETGG
jgi:hypothetical protein